MVDFVFSDNSGNVIPVRTDAVDTSTNNFTILEVNNGPGGFANLSNALQQLFGSTNLAIGPVGTFGGAVSIGTMIALAQAVGMNLIAYPVGAAVSTPVTFNSPTLSTPTLTAATGTGATGTTALSWTAVTNATNFVVDRATNSGFTAGVTLGRYNGPLRVFNDSGLTGGSTYYYRVRAQGTGFTDSAESTVQSAVAHA